MWGVSDAKTKQALRSAGLSRRDSLSSPECLRLSHEIQARALEFSHYLASRSVALYSAIQNEVRTDSILAHALRHGKNVYYPRIGKDRTIGLFQVLSPDDLRAGRFDILEPGGNIRLPEAEYKALTIFVPGVVFDAEGNRLGRGQGFYDRLLQITGEVPTITALAYEFQVVEAVPHELGDRRVHYLITERSVIDCGIVSAQSSQIS